MNVEKQRKEREDSEEVKMDTVRFASFLVQLCCSKSSTLKQMGTVRLSSDT